MFCRSLRLINYRNFRKADFAFSPRLNVLVGDNGRGKTNLIESIFLMLTGNSFRFSDNNSLIHFGENEAALQLKMEKEDLEFTLKTELTKSRKRFFKNGKPCSSVDLQKTFGVILFSPESLNSIKEGSDQRRLLIDEMLVVFEKNNAELITSFKKALKTRNRILKNFTMEKESKAQTIALIESINPQYLTLASDLSFARTQALSMLQADFQEAMRSISKSVSVDISVEYWISDQNCLKFSRKNIAKLLENRMSELFTAELASGSSLVGPHKHDIVFLYNQKDSRIYCSQGQQRAVILSFKIAQIVYHRKVHGVYPILLLDDVLSELDKSKRDSLISFLHEINTQIFITTTDFNLPSSFTLDNLNVIKMNE